MGVYIGVNLSIKLISGENGMSMTGHRLWEFSKCLGVLKVSEVLVGPERHWFLVPLYMDASKLVDVEVMDFSRYPISLSRNRFGKKTDARRTRITSYKGKKLRIIYDQERHPKKPPKINASSQPESSR